MGLRGSREGRLSHDEPLVHCARRKLGIEARPSPAPGLPHSLRPGCSRPRRRAAGAPPLGALCFGPPFGCSISPSLCFVATPSPLRRLSYTLCFWARAPPRLPGPLRDRPELSRRSEKVGTRTLSRGPGGPCRGAGGHETVLLGRTRLGGRGLCVETGLRAFGEIALIHQVNDQSNK